MGEKLNKEQGVNKIFIKTIKEAIKTYNNLEEVIKK